MTPTLPNANLDANHRLVNDANLCQTPTMDLVNDATGISTKSVDFDRTFSKKF